MLPVGPYMKAESSKQDMADESSFWKVLFWDFIFIFLQRRECQYQMSD